MVKYLFLFSLISLYSVLHGQYTPISEVSRIDSIQIETPNRFSIVGNFNKPTILTPSMALFCRIERRIEKKASIPVRMRLGSLQYVNGLEGKAYNPKEYLLLTKNN